MTTLFEAAVQVLAGGAGPGAWTDLRLCSTPFTLAYSGATGDVVRFDCSYDGTRAVTGDQRTIGAGNGGAISFAPMDVEGNFIAANYVRCEVVSGNSGATATATATGASLSVAKTTVALAVNNTATPAAWVDTTGLIGPVTLFYEGFSGDQIYVQGSDTNGGGAVAVPYYPGPGTSARVGASWAITIPKLQKYLRTVRSSGTTAGALCGVTDATSATTNTSPTTQIWTSRAVPDTAASGPLGLLSAPDSVDNYSVLITAQTTALVVATLATPSVTTATRMELVANTGPGASATLYLYGQAIPVGCAAWFFWTGLAWKPTNSLVNGGNSGAAAVGSLDNTTSLIGNGSEFASDNGTSTIAGRATATAGAGTTLRGGTAGVAVSSGAGVGVTTAVGEALRMLPSGVGAGQTGRVAFRELAAGGTDEITMRAPDALAASVNYTLPPAAPTIDNQALTATIAGAMAWRGAVQVLANNSSGQSIADGGGAVVLTGWTSVVDTAAAFTAATGAFVAPVTGNYDVTCEIEFTAIAAVVGAEFTIQIYVNGSLVAAGVETCQVAAANVKRQPKIALAAIPITAGQTMNVRASQTSGSGANTLTFITSRNLLSISLCV